MKGIILTAGYGTRFLPVTKTVPKEMLPLGTRPALDYVVEEFVAAGVTDLLIINSRRKKILEDYYDREPELEGVFLAEGREAHRRRITPPDGVRFYFVRQQRMGGTGDAVLLARQFAADDPCILAFPDDIHVGAPPLARQLYDVYLQTGCSVLALEERPPEEDISRYGVAALERGSDPLRVTGLIEKPPRGTEPSRAISVGRYLLTPDLFEALEEERRRHSSGEFYLTAAFHRVAQEGRLRGCVYRGERLDTGEPLGYLEACLRVALADPETEPRLRTLLRKLLDASG